MHYLEEVKGGRSLEPGLGSPPYAAGVTGPYPVSNARGRPPSSQSSRERSGSMPPGFAGLEPSAPGLSLLEPTRRNKKETGLRDEVMSVASQPPSITAHLADDAPPFEDDKAKQPPPLPAMPSPAEMATSISRMNLLEMGQHVMVAWSVVQLQLRRFYLCLRRLQMQKVDPTKRPSRCR